MNDSPFIDAPETTTVRVLHTTPEREEWAYSELIAEGYTQSDEPMDCGSYIGHTFCKYTPWNIAYDFVIVSVIPGY